MQKRVLTMGYESSDLGRFVDSLQTNGVEIVLDIREVPISRKAGFSKTKLCRAIVDAGLDYIHLRELGDPKPGRDAAKAGDFQRFRAIFENHLASDCAQAALAMAADLASTATLCLVCFERDHEHCHRTIVAQDLSERIGSEVVHIKPQRSVTRQGQAAKVSDAKHVRRVEGRRISEGGSTCKQQAS